MELRKYIDHTLLKPDATEEQINQIIEDAKTYQFASVCVNPYWVNHCYDRLKETNVKVCTVIGFPLGTSTTSIKVAETKEAIQSGAEEVDMVINIGALKMNDDETVKNDILAVVNAAKDKALVKVIIETALLNNDEKKRACQLALEAGADFVKTSTGFLGGGATVEDVKLMRQTVGDHMGVKASGGIRDRKTAEAMIAAGATRIGASSGVSIVQEEK
ncbi:deoxyribose-phosphate aldolase [Cerasibacillus quisquiliarum]|uniref:Deoxyribose-phosphate aldolase n=1 Tax=Cerasibacillus quisquiliarum TaxID=227865 RepID=A0A511UZ82_9BACI|nr:deoxyribose-phosphate aldolase [Cerasibacillus quisquiliarum]MBB5145546.1 deoxyribose-phosphate aldolase [Cerasibacillus quisquiliarum]GEN31058.1 deoxyribose-phosphate aldolase [Cerasibacillus quisquiliarum]